MPSNNEIAILTCLNPVCRFRFHTNQTLLQQKCPKCGAATYNQEINIESNLSAVPSSSIARFPIEILLDNIRSAYNVGAILRSADGVGAAHIHVCGITPAPAHPKVLKTSLMQVNRIPWSQHWNALDVVNDARTRGVFVCSLETQNEAISIFNLNQELLHFPLLLAVGNEVSGVDPDILNSCDLTISIPMFGSKKSLNVASAFSIAVYFIRQSGISSWSI